MRVQQGDPFIHSLRFCGAPAAGGGTEDGNREQSANVPVLGGFRFAVIDVPVNCKGLHKS